MANELSIEKIKKDIIDKLQNNMEILKYLEVDKCEGIKLDKLNNIFIFPYDMPNMSGNYISVEVSEYERSEMAIRSDRKHVISIRVGLNKKDNLDRMSDVIKGIVLKIYPDIRKVNNEPFCIKSNDCFGNNCYEINRILTFEIK